MTSTLIPELDGQIDTVVLDKLEFAPGCQICHYMPFFNLDLQCQREAAWMVLFADTHPCCGTKRAMVEIFVCDPCYQGLLEDRYPGSHEHKTCKETYRVSEVVIMADRIHG